MTLLTSAFWWKVSRGHKRSTEVKNSRKRSIFGLGLNLMNCISKWSSWRQLSDKRCLEVIKGHLRSKITNVNGKNCSLVIFDNVSFRILNLTNLNYLKTTVYFLINRSHIFCKFVGQRLSWGMPAGLIHQMEVFWPFWYPTMLVLFGAAQWPYFKFICLIKLTEIKEQN